MHKGSFFTGKIFVLEETMMKKLVILLALLALAIPVQAEIVSNGGFEIDDNPDGTYYAAGWGDWEWGGWRGFKNNDPLADGGGDSGYAAYAGTAYGYAGASSDWGAVAGINQTVSPTVGVEYIASVYYSTESWGTDNSARLVIKWWGDFGGGVTEIKTTYSIIDDSGPINGTWNYFSVNTGAVPVGTTSAQYELEAGGHNTSPGDGGSVLFDNASMVAVPEPMTVGLLGLGCLFLRRRKA
jgi:hypothetical protein